MRVHLVAVSKPLLGDGDPRRLVVLAVKTSHGKVHEKGYSHYLTNYSNLSTWLVEASKGFPSVLEHIVFTFLIDGISRVTSHQLVRHRIASYTQESQRYTEYRVIACLECLAKVWAETTLKLRDRDEYDVLTELLGEAHIAWLTALHNLSSYVDYFNEAYNDIVECLNTAFRLDIIGENLDENVYHLLNTLTHYVVLRYEYDYPMEIARYVLPQCIKTSMVMTVNLRELLHIACLRLSHRAQKETREVVEAMIREVEKVIPEIKSLIENYCRCEV